MVVYDDILDMIGNTPFLRLSTRHSLSEIFLKMEKYNPGQSIKDRAALNMILEAEKSGALRPGYTIIESSSGNTGIALAMTAAARGYKFICVVDNHAPNEKIEIMRAYGARVERAGQHLPPNVHAPAERKIVIERLLQTIPNAFYVDQGDNLYNRASHYKTTAEEIINTFGKIDFLFASVGTGGSISGTAKRLKEINPHMIAVGIEPAGSVIFGKPFQPFYQSGAGSGCLIFKNIDFSIIDENYQVSDKEAFNTCLYLARKKGILVGGSSGAVIYKTLQYITTNKCEGVAVALMPDGGERYVSTIFNDEWMKEHGLIDDSVETFLDGEITKSFSVV